MLVKEVQKIIIILVLMICVSSILLFSLFVKTVEMNQKIDVLIEKVEKGGK